MAWAADGSSLVTCGQTHKESPPLVFWVKDASTGSFANKRYITQVFCFRRRVPVGIRFQASPSESRPQLRLLDPLFFTKVTFVSL